VELQNILLRKCGLTKDPSQRMSGYGSVSSRNVELLKMLLEKCGIIEDPSQRMSGHESSFSRNVEFLRILLIECELGTTKTARPAVCFFLHSH